MGERVKTKTLKNGRKLVVVKIGKNFHQDTAI